MAALSPVFAVLFAIQVHIVLEKRESSRASQHFY